MENHRIKKDKLNAVYISGRLTHKPEMTETAGTPLCKFTIANNDGYGKHQHTNFIKCQVWGKPAQNFVKNTNIGSQVMITNATLKQNQWRTAEGTLKTETVVNCSWVDFDFPTPKSQTRKQTITEEDYIRQLEVEQASGDTQVTKTTEPKTNDDQYEYEVPF